MCGLQWYVAWASVRTTVRFLLTFTETIRLIRDGEKGWGVGGGGGCMEVGGEGDYIPIATLSPPE